MGSRTDDTLREVELIRARLDGTLRQLEGRMPPLARIGKRAIGVAGGTLGAGVLLAVGKRVLKRKRPAAATTTPVVTVRSGVSLPAALAVAAVWAGVRIFEAKQRAATGEPERRASLAVLPQERRA